MTRLLGIMLTMLVLMHGPTPAVACPNCKEAVSLQSEDVANVANGYNWSVLFMLVVPFSMIGTGAVFVHRAAKRGQLPEL